MNRVARGTLYWCIALCGVSTASDAQYVTGTIRERSGDTPAAGILLSFVEEISGRTMIRALSNGAGDFRVRLPAAGRYHVITKRIGVRPSRSEVFSIGAGETVQLSLVVERTVAPLATVNVITAAVCGEPASEAAATARLLEEVRAALITTTLSQRTRTIRGEIGEYVRTIDAATEQVQSDSIVVRPGVYDRPFRSIAAESLSAHGYVAENRDGSLTFFAPDPEVLASDAFLNTHCFQPVAHPSDSMLVGLSVRPMPSRRQSDIEGVLWIEREAAELRRLDVRYTRLPLGVEDSRVGATIAFRRLSSGMWIVSEWVIRTPLVKTFRYDAVRLARLAVRAVQVDSLVGIQEEGGFVSLGEAGGSVLGAITGRVSASAAGARAPGIIIVLSGTRRIAFPDSLGNFSFDRVLPGRYALIASRATTKSSPGALAITRVVVMPSQTAHVELELGIGGDVSNASCPPARSQRERAALHLVFIDTTKMLVLPSLDFVLHVSHQEALSLDRVHLRRDALNGQSSRDGAFTSCDRKPGERVGVVVSGDTRAALRPLGQIQRSELEVRHVLLHEDVSSRANRVPIAGSAPGATIVGTVTSTGPVPTGEAAEVVLLSSGATVRTDACHQFVLNGVAPGEHTIRIRPPSGRAFNLIIAIPTRDSVFLNVQLPATEQEPPKAEITDRVSVDAAGQSCQRGVSFTAFRR
jgi:hypothetical protein